LIGGLVLAAGASRRFGGVKQVAQFRGRPLLEHALVAMEAVERRVVVLGANADVVSARVPLHGAEPVVADDWNEGLSASLRAGVTALDDCEAVVVTLGDQPRVSPDAIRRVIAGRNGDSAIRATYNGNPGHPVLLEQDLYEQLRDVSGDKGARNLLLSVPVRDIPCDDLGGGEDVDTPAELDTLRAGGPVTGAQAT
jgi:CTP:molybdopterin cytidylyltransferase MocA